MIVQAVAGKSHIPTHHLYDWDPETEVLYQVDENFEIVSLGKVCRAEYCTRPTRKCGLCSQPMSEAIDQQDGNYIWWCKTCVRAELRERDLPELVDDVPMTPIPERCTIFDRFPAGAGRMEYRRCGGEVRPSEGFYKCADCGISYGPVEQDS